MPRAARRVLGRRVERAPALRADLAVNLPEPLDIHRALGQVGRRERRPLAHLRGPQLLHLPEPPGAVVLGVRLDPPDRALEPRPPEHVVHLRRPLRRIQRQLHQAPLRHPRLSRPAGERLRRVLGARHAPHDQMAQRLLPRCARLHPAERAGEVGLPQRQDRRRHRVEAAGPAEVHGERRRGGLAVAALGLDRDHAPPAPVDHLEQLGMRHQLRSRLPSRRLAQQADLRLVGVPPHQQVDQLRLADRAGPVHREEVPELRPQRVRALGARLERPEQAVQSLGVRRPRIRREQRHPPARQAKPMLRRADLLLERRRLLDAELVGEELARAPLGDELRVVLGRQRRDERFQAVEQEVESAGRRLPGDAPLVEPVQKAGARVPLAQAADLLRGGALPHVRVVLGDEHAQQLEAVPVAQRGGPLPRPRAPRRGQRHQRVVVPQILPLLRAEVPRGRFHQQPHLAGRRPAPRWSGAPAPARPAPPATRGRRPSSPRSGARGARARSGAWTGLPDRAHHRSWRPRPARREPRSRGPARGPRSTGARRGSGACGRAPPRATGRPPTRPAAARVRPGAAARSRPRSAGPPRPAAQGRRAIGAGRAPGSGGRRASGRAGPRGGRPRRARRRPDLSLRTRRAARPPTRRPSGRGRRCAPRR